MTQYLVLIYGEEKAYTEGGQGLFDEVMKGHNDFGNTYAEKVLGGNALQSVETATSVRKDSSGAFTVTDGPFVETKEALGGYYLVEAADLDEAIEMAKAIPCPGGGLEVRPVMVFG
jgi:hypothetical protein